MPDSEFRIYNYIERTLQALKWDTRNPAKGGSVYTQGEFRANDELLAQALGAQAPENVVCIPWEAGLVYWVIEAKSSHGDLEIGLNEAQDYARQINDTHANAARFATGIAGSDEYSYYVRTTFWDGVEWHDVKINNFGTTGFLTLQQCETILQQNRPEILDYDVDLDLFLDKANAINAALHEYGIAARDRAGLVAGILLALVEDSNLRIAENPRTLVNDLNTRIKELLTRHSKSEVSAEVTLKLPATTENHRKYWSGIVKTMQHLREMNIRSAINSGTDALGQFYETFLRFANDASEMGIVLTPRHVTRFAVQSIGLSREDRVFDPTCGTGGFLVAALDEIRARHYDTHRDVYDAFRNDCLYGVEQADNVFGLALVNMIFRGDGKSFIHNGNCFDNKFVLSGSSIERLYGNRREPPGASGRPFTRVLMNPPFAVAEKEHEFVDYALDQLTETGLLFAILPNKPITGKYEAAWRKRLIQDHTVKAVVRMPGDLFYPTASKGTYALVVEAWRPHQDDDDVFFAIMSDDEHATGKSKLISHSRQRDNVEMLTRELRRFLSGGSSGISEVSRELSIATLRTAGLYDFASEAYIRDGATADPESLDATYGLLAALTDIERRESRVSSGPVVGDALALRIEEIFSVERGRSRPLKELEYGDTPIVTTSEARNGIAGFYSVSPDTIRQDRVTISANGSGGKAFWHPYEFAATADVLVCEPRGDVPTDHAVMLYICDAISEESWRFDYYRKCSEERLLNDVRIRLPATGNQIDWDAVRSAVHASPGFDRLLHLLAD